MPFPIKSHGEMWQQSGKSMGSRVGLLFYLFCFVLNMGEITAYLYAGRNSPVEKEKTMVL